MKFKSEWRDLILAGKKTCTCRPFRCAKEGQIFEAFGKKFKIIRVFRTSFKYALEFYQQDGFRSKDEMKNWFERNVKTKYKDDSPIWVHFFEAVEEEEND